MQFLIFLFLAARIKQELITATTSTHGCAHTHSEWNKDWTSVFFLLLFALLGFLIGLFSLSRIRARTYKHKKSSRIKREAEKHVIFWRGKWNAAVQKFPLQGGCTTSVSPDWICKIEFAFHEHMKRVRVWCFPFGWTTTKSALSLTFSAVHTKEPECTTINGKIWRYI